MAKEYYDVSRKTYFNDRIKPTVFQGNQSYPLYVQVTYDRKTAFFKSYYFDLFARRKYDFLQTTFSQIDELESRVIDFIVDFDYKRFDLDRLSSLYKLLSKDILESFEESFKIWLTAYLKQEGYPALSALLEYAPDEVCVIQVWDDLKKILDREIFNKMELIGLLDGPYLPLAMYVRYASPEGPFCLPVHEFGDEKKRFEIEDFTDDMLWKVSFWRIARDVKSLLYPRGFVVP